MTACPYCGKEMESGFVRANSNGGVVVAWTTKMTQFGLGDTIASGWPPYIDALRCADCKAILFRY